MAKRNHRPRRRSDAKARPLPQESDPVRSPQDEQAVDGILVQINQTDLTIAGERPGQVQKLPGYEVKVAIPDWDKNRGLLDSVRKGHLAQKKLFAKLQSDGASRPWVGQRFDEIDKAIAASLTTIAERIRTRRWRKKERADALKRLRDAFRDLQRWTAKATRYCERAPRCPDPVQKETLLDAACLAILKVGEFVNQVDRMQHGFWEDFSAGHFLDMRNKRNLIGHTDNLEGEDVIPLGMGVVKDLNTAIRRTLFPEHSGPGAGGFMIPTSAVRELEPTRPGEKPTPGNSIAMIRIDEHNRFVINRVGRSEDNTILVSSSVTGSMNVSVHAVGTS